MHTTVSISPYTYLKFRSKRNRYTNVPILKWKFTAMKMFVCHKIHGNILVDGATKRRNFIKSWNI